MSETPIVLREDQAETIGRLRAGLKEHQSVLLRGECGWGKTVVAAYMALGAQKHGKRFIFDVHRRELARQTARTFERFGIRFSFIADKMYYDPFALVQIASTKTLVNRPGLIRGDFLVPDEAHILGAQRLHVINTMREQGARIIPLTATPQYRRGVGLGHIADKIVEGPGAPWLMERKFLASYRAYAPVSPDFSAVPIRQGEYTTAGVEKVLDKPSVIGSRIDSYKKFAPGKRMLGFCYSRKNGIDTARDFTAAGIPSGYIDGETSDADRIEAIRKFADGDFKCLFNVALCEEGFDLSAQVGRNVPVEAVMLGKPSKSLQKAIQMMMRPLRPQDEYGVIIDHVNLLREHGFPDDEREWSLDSGGKMKMDVAREVNSRTCPKCFGSFKTGYECPYCHSTIEIKDRKVKEVEGEIAEIKREAVIQKEVERRYARMEVGMAKTIEEVCAVAVDRGYSEGWVLNLFRARKTPPDKTPTYKAVEKMMLKIRLEKAA